MRVGKEMMVQAHTHKPTNTHLDVFKQECGQNDRYVLTTSGTFYSRDHVNKNKTEKTVIFQNGAMHYSLADQRLSTEP